MYSVMFVILCNDYAKGLNLAFKLFRILNDGKKVDVAEYAETLRLILFPTVFEDREWVKYVKIDETHFCKKMGFKNQKENAKDLTKSNQKGSLNPASSHTIKRNEAIALQFAQKEKSSKNIGSQVMAMIPILRSVTSILAIEL